MKRIFSALIFGLTLMSTLATVQAKENIKLGLIVPLTGDVKTFGESAKNGFQIALEEYGHCHPWVRNPDQGTPGQLGQIHRVSRRFQGVHRDSQDRQSGIGLLDHRLLNPYNPKPDFFAFRPFLAMYQG